MNIRTLLILSFVATTAISNPSFAGDPACEGRDQGICDTLGAMINLRGQGCYQMLSINPLGGDVYSVTCELSSSDPTHVTYTIDLGS